MEDKILDLFLYDNKLRFNEIEKNLNIRSNKLAYHLKKLVKTGILTKKQDSYELSPAAEHLLPYLSDKKAVLPVVLVHIGDKNKAFLYERQKRPFKNYLSLPGGRILIKESIEQAAKRIMKEKFNLPVKIKKINSVSLEQVKKSGKIIHTFLLIFASAETKEKIKLTDLRNNKSKIIPSDYNLITNSDCEIKINLLTSRVRS